MAGWLNLRKSRNLWRVAFCVLRTGNMSLELLATIWPAQGENLLGLVCSSHLLNFAVCFFSLFNSYFLSSWYNSSLFSFSFTVSSIFFYSCPTHHGPMDCSPPCSFVHGIFQARTLEWAAISSSRGSSQPRDRTWVSCVSCNGRQILYTEPAGKACKELDSK